MLGLLKKIFNTPENGVHVVRRPLYIKRLKDRVKLHRHSNGLYINKADKNDYIPIKLAAEIIDGKFPDAYTLSEKEAPDFHHHP